MSQEEVLRFRNLVNNSPELQEKVRGATSDNLAQVILALGKEHGYHFNADEIQAVARQSNLELSDCWSDFELDLIAGVGRCLPRRFRKKESPGI